MITDKYWFNYRGVLICPCLTNRLKQTLKSRPYGRQRNSYAIRTVKPRKTRPEDVVTSPNLSVSIKTGRRLDESTSVLAVTEQTAMKRNGITSFCGRWLYECGGTTTWQWPAMMILVQLLITMTIRCNITFSLLVKLRLFYRCFFVCFNYSCHSVRTSCWIKRQLTYLLMVRWNTNNNDSRTSLSRRSS